jgi:CRISPR-associated exonuclease Cas4
MEPYFPLSYLNHFVYCPRRFWYMYVLGEIAVNAPMFEGTLQHDTRAHQPGQETDRHGSLVQRRLWVWSDRLQIAGFADFVEEQASALVPVEYKHGKQGRWNNDRIQLCAQALCLEEMTGRDIERGEIFYWRSRRRIDESFDLDLRQATEQTIFAARALLAAGIIPPPLAERAKCPHCSIEPICLPDEVVRLTQQRSSDNATEQASGQRPLGIE